MLARQDKLARRWRTLDQHDLRAIDPFETLPLPADARVSVVHRQLIAE